MAKKHKYGWVPDTPDHRDRYYLPAAGITYPPRVDLWEPSGANMCIIPIEDQRETSSCVGNSTGRAMEFIHACTDQAGTRGKHTDVSRMFIYYGARWIMQWHHEDAGCQIRDAIKVLARNGACLEKLWPFKEQLLFTQPTEAAFADAKRRMATHYRRVSGLEGFKAALAAGYPVVFGFTVYSSVEKPEVQKTGRIVVPKTRGFFKERILGGHAVLATGYDDMMEYRWHDGRVGRGCVIFDNSWGTGWGDKGRGYMPYPMIESPSITSDSWVITGVRYT
jgi:C1A family cysteine protease